MHHSTSIMIQLKLPPTNQPKNPQRLQNVWTPNLTQPMIITIEYCRHSWREKRENTTTTRTWKPSHEWRKRLTRSRHECDSLTRTFVLLVRVHTFSMISPDRYTLLKTAVLCAGSCRVRFSDFVSSEFFKMLTFFAMWFWKKTFICIGEIYVFFYLFTFFI